MRKFNLIDSNNISFRQYSLTSVIFNFTITHTIHNTVSKSNNVIKKRIWWYSPKMLMRFWIGTFISSKSGTGHLIFFLPEIRMITKIRSATMLLLLLLMIIEIVRINYFHNIKFNLININIYFSMLWNCIKSITILYRLYDTFKDTKLLQNSEKNQIFNEALLFPVIQLEFSGE